MNNPLATIQKISKIGKILSKIVFIFCIIGCVGCLVGIVGVAVGAQVVFSAGGNLQAIILAESGMAMGDVYGAMVVGALMSAGEIVVSWFGMQYFKRELEAGTPFTYEGSRELQRLGILSIVVPLVTALIAGIAYGILVAVLGGGAKDIDMELGGSVSTGVMLLVMALLCRLGAHQQQGRIE